MEVNFKRHQQSCMESEGSQRNGNAGEIAATQDSRWRSRASGSGGGCNGASSDGGNLNRISTGRSVQSVERKSKVRKMCRQLVEASDVLRWPPATTMEEDDGGGGGRRSAHILSVPLKLNSPSLDPKRSGMWYFVSYRKEQDMERDGLCRVESNISHLPHLFIRIILHAGGSTARTISLEGALAVMRCVSAAYNTAERSATLVRPSRRCRARKTSLKNCWRGADGDARCEHSGVRRSGAQNDARQAFLSMLCQRDEHKTIAGGGAVCARCTTQRNAAQHPSGPPVDAAPEGRGRKDGWRGRCVRAAYDAAQRSSSPPADAAPEGRADKEGVSV
ncbi:hypothetical protein K438DRAFT_1756227 [Mycena galopus ATCC 62051]|nr:hypothetical protein K438DRAFT_1756227 [Mycena galopus ATCC 62051]